MRLLRHFLTRVMPRRRDADLDDELRAFYEASVEAKLAAGMPRAQAERAARIELGSPAAVKEYVRDGTWGAWLESVWQDVRYATRLLRRSPGFAAAAIGTLAVGLGATAAMFAVLDAVLLRPLPYAEPDRVVELRFGNQTGGVWGVGAGAIAAVRDLPAVEHAAGIISTERALLAPDVSLLVMGDAATEEFFQVFGVPAAIGRTFSPVDREAGAVVVLSDRLWRRAFSSRPDVVGEHVSMNGVPHLVLGVMPPDFRTDLGLRDDVDFWVLYRISSAEAADFGHGSYRAVVRLRTADHAIARAQLAGLDLPPARTDTGEPLTLRLIPPLDVMSTFYGRILWSLLGAVALVLLLACGNVANLLLARGRQRAPELVIRGAIGASRGRIARQLLVECAVLAAAAAAAGAAVAWLLIAAVPLLPVDTMNIARMDQVAASGRVYGFLLVLTAATVLVFGLFPAIAAARPGSAGVRSVTRRRGRASQALIALEVAATVALLVGSGAVAVRVAALMSTEVGFDLDGLQMASLRPMGPEYQDAGLTRLYQDVLDRLRERSGIEAVVIDRPPLDFWRAEPVGVLPPKPGEEEVRAGLRVMSAGALTFLGADLIAGRDFRTSDGPGAPPAGIVNASLAARLVPAGASPVGATVTLIWRDERRVLQIVGVVNDLRDSVYRPAGPEIFLSAPQFPPRRASFVLRSQRPAEQTAAALREALRDVDPRQAVSDVASFGGRIRLYTALSRFVGILLIAFAALAVLLAATGVLAVVGGAVASRTREIGIRVALGARRRHVVAALSHEFVPALAAGACGGFAAAYALSNVIRALVPGIAAFHPAAYAAALGGVGLVAVIGAWWPIRRAAH
jgi:putative ABC transport system permease protein